MSPEEQSLMDQLLAIARRLKGIDLTAKVAFGNFMKKKRLLIENAGDKLTPEMENMIHQTLLLEGLDAWYNEAADELSAWTDGAIGDILGD